MQIATYSVVVDKKWFTGLPEELQKVISDAVNDIASKQWQDSINSTEKAYQVIKRDFKATIYEVPENELSQWSVKVQPAIGRFSKQFPDTFNAFKELNKKHSREWPVQ